MMKMTMIMIRRKTAAPTPMPMYKIVSLSNPPAITEVDKTDTMDGGDM